MHPALIKALAEAQALSARGWQRPGDATLVEAGRLLRLLAAGGWREPEVSVAADGSIDFEWDAGAHGWVQLTLRGDGQLVHAAVIEGDEFGQAEAFGDELPDWVRHVLQRLLGYGH